MKLEELLAVLGTIKKGAYVSINKRKDYGKGVTKITTMRTRIGCDYSKMKNVIAKRAEAQLMGRDMSAGTSGGSLPWGNWVSGYEKLIIEHKGNYYLRIAECYTKGIASRNSQYYYNGEPVSKEAIVDKVAPSKLKSSAAGVYTVKLDDIISITQNHKK